MFLRLFGKRGNEKSKEVVGAGAAIDPEMFYCHACGGEFRYRLDRCPSCAVELESGVERRQRLQAGESLLLSRSMELTPGCETVNLRKGLLRDMQELQRVLARKRIPSLLGGERGECGKGCCGPELYLKIRPEDVDEALQALAEEFVRTTAVDSRQLSQAAAVFDPSAAEALCPACGCRFSPTVGACPDCGLAFE